MKKIVLITTLLLTHMSPLSAKEDWYKPLLDSSWHWQLQGEINSAYNVDMYDIDLFDSSKSLIASLQADGKKVICYFSAGSYEEWRDDATLFSEEVKGKNLDGWEGEKWLDIRDSSLEPIMVARLDLAKDKGCDGVEPDNMDNYTNDSGFSLTAEDQLAYNKFIASAAHERSLSVGLKNDLDQIVELEPFFDFSVNEECHFYNECEMMQPFIDAEKPVFHVEYEKKYINNTNNARTEMCLDSLHLKFNTLVLPLDLDDAYRYSCKHMQITEPSLLFSSGFEGDVNLSDLSEDGYQYIQGKDSVTEFSWPINILGASGSALHYIDHDDKSAINNKIQTVINHKGDLTKALYSIENYDIGVTQSPYEILDIKEGRRDLYIRYWIKLDSDSLQKISKWRTFFEYKTKDYATGDGFRLIAFIYTDDAGNPYWHWQGDSSPETPVWEINNKSIPVPMDEWFLTEFYWHWSEGADGRALWRINNQVVGDHYGATTRNNKPIDFIMLTQIYGDANPKYQWVDDIEIWDSLPKSKACISPIINYLLF